MRRITFVIFVSLFTLVIWQLSLTKPIEGSNIDLSKKHSNPSSALLQSSFFLQDDETRGRIYGVVTSEVTGEPISDLYIRFKSLTNSDYSDSARTDENGRFSRSMPVGSYYLKFLPSDPLYIPEYNNDIPNAGTFPERDVPPIIVDAGAEIEVNAALASNSVYEGKVSHKETGLLVGKGSVICVDPISHEALKIEYLDIYNPGRYKMYVNSSSCILYFRAFNDPFVDEYYADADNIESATVVNVPAGSSKEINFEVGFGPEGGGLIFGEVTALDTGKPITDTYVYITRAPAMTSAGSVIPDEKGQYEILVGPGSYYISFEPTPGSPYAAEHFDNIYDRNYTIVDVSDGMEIEANAELERKGKIVGLVTGNGAPISSGYVEADGQSRSGIGYGYKEEFTVDDKGRYTLTVQPDQYELFFFSHDTNFTSEYYDDAEGRDEATLVEVPLNTTVEINVDLDGPAVIYGRVTRADTGEPIEDGFVIPYFKDNGASKLPTVDIQSNGSYTIYAPPGEYDLFYGAAIPGYIDEYYEDAYIRRDATAISVTNGTILEIDVALEPEGLIQGRLTYAESGEPVSQGWVSVYDVSNPRDESFRQLGYGTDEDGQYSIPVPGGEYYVKFSSSNTVHLPEFFENAISRDDATPIKLDSGDTVTVNASLELGTEVSGRLTTSDSGMGLADVKVFAYKQGKSSPGCYDQDDVIYETFTDENGVYTLYQFRPGTYDLVFETQRFSDSNGYLSSSLENIVVADDNLTAPTVVMQLGGQIRGTVMDESSSSTLKDIDVIAYRYTYHEPTNSYYWWEEDSTITNGLGQYTLSGLPDGQYAVFVQGEFPDSVRGDTSQFVQASFGDGVGQRVSETGEVEFLQSIEITESEIVEDVNIAMNVGGRISGYVTAEDTGEPLYNVDILVYTVDSDGQRRTYRSTATDRNGYFVSYGLPAGEVYIEFGDTWADGGQTYMAETYADYSSTGHLLPGTPVMVEAGATTIDVNAQLNRGALIQGNVWGDYTDFHVELVKVSLLDGLGREIKSTFSSDVGYSMYGVPPGKYYLQYHNSDPSWWYERLSLPRYEPREFCVFDTVYGGYYGDVLDIQSAKPIEIVGTETVKDVDFTMRSSGDYATPNIVTYDLFVPMAR